jgi:RimJ/RimL family protein N-acetyltransferase
LVCAELRGPEHLGLLLNATVPADWPPGEYDRGAQEFFRDRLREGGDSAVGWYGWYAVRRGEQDTTAVVVGAGGFIGPPNDTGSVEIGFSIATEWRSQGFATELVSALLAFAFGNVRVMQVQAHASVENRASCRVLEKAGMRRAAVEENGLLRFQVNRRSN